MRRSLSAEAANGKNPDLKQFAADTLPVVKSHLAMLEGMKGMAGETEKNHHAAKPSAAPPREQERRGPRREWRRREDGSPR